MSPMVQTAMEVGSALFKELIHAAHDGALTSEHVERAKRITEDLAAARAEREIADAIMRGEKP